MVGIFGPQLVKGEYLPLSSKCSEISHRSGGGGSAGVVISCPLGYSSSDFEEEKGEE